MKARAIVVLLLALGLTAAPVVCPGCMSSPGSEESTVDWPKISKVLTVASMQLDDVALVVKDPEDAEDLQQAAAACRLAADAAAAMAPGLGATEDPIAKIQAALDALTPLLDSDDEELALAVLAIKSGLNIAAVVAE